MWLYKDLYINYIVGFFYRMLDFIKKGGVLNSLKFNLYIGCGRRGE